MKADLHIHSDHSADGTCSVEDMLDAVRALRMECVAFTDHNTMDGYREALGMADDLVIIPAVEVSSAEGHVLAYGIDREIAPGMPVLDTIMAIHDAGGIAVAAHPYRVWSGLGEDNVLPEFDAIEVLNGRSAKSGNHAAARLAARMGRPGTAGSDAHCVEQMGNAYCTLPAGCRDVESVIEAIVGGRAVPRGEHRSIGGSVSYAMKAVGEWAGRGFRRI